MRERRDLEFPEQLREENAPDFGADPWARDGWQLGRAHAAEMQKCRKQDERHLSFAKTRFICVFNNFAFLSPNQTFRDQNLILV